MTWADLLDPASVSHLLFAVDFPACHLLGPLPLPLVLGELGLFADPWKMYVTGQVLSTGVSGDVSHLTPSLEKPTC